ncbi:hypothetical protein J2W42_002950 [Rhizobium tibeticum]|nr:hypothetical protein [Rhizobium tibeticum]
MTTRHNSATALFFAGLALAAAAPLANLVGRSLRRRGRRITLITQELEGLKTASVGTGVLQFGSAAAKGSKRPLSMIMGERTVNAIAARLRIYCILFAALLTASVVFASAAYWVWVPDPARNSVFRTVSLAGDAYEFAGEAGLQVAIRMDEPRAGSIMWQYLSYGTCIGLIVLATRRSRYLGLAVAIVILSFLGLNSIRLPDHSRYEVEASQLSPEMRSQLADAAGLGMKSGIEPERNAFPTASLTLRGTASLEGAAAHRSPVRMAAINPSIAAYTLAQLAYLDADTAAASTWLNRIENIVDLHPTVHQLKLASVQEWLSANGISSAEQWFSTDFVAMVRLIAHFLLAASIFAMASGAVVAIAVMIAARRGNRIEALMEERDRSPT